MKPGTVSRTVSISRRTDASERFWMIRPSCSVIEQKRAAAEAAAHDRDREPDHLVGGDLRVAVARVRLARVGQLVDAVHLRRSTAAAAAGSARRRARRGAGPARARSPGSTRRAGGARRARTAPDRRRRRRSRACARPCARGRRAAAGWRAARSTAPAPSPSPRARRRLRPRPCGSAVGVGIDGRRRAGPACRPSCESISVQPSRRRPVGRENAVPRTSVMLVGAPRPRPAGARSRRSRARRCRRPAGRPRESSRTDRRTLFGPVVVVGDPAQAGLDAADDDRHVAERLAAALRVDDHRAIGAPAARAARRVGVVVPQPPVGGVAVDHRVHVAGGDAPHDGRAAERAERLGARASRAATMMPDPEALRLEQAPDQRHPEARVIDVGVAGHQDDVAAVPAERVHLGARRRQHGRDAEALGPDTCGARTASAAPARAKSARNPRSTCDAIRPQLHAAHDSTERPPRPSEFVACCAAHGGAGTAAVSAHRAWASRSRLQLLGRGQVERRAAGHLARRLLLQVDRDRPDRPAHLGRAVGERRQDLPGLRPRGPDRRLQGLRRPVR